MSVVLPLLAIAVAIAVIGARHQRKALVVIGVVTSAVLALAALPALEDAVGSKELVVRSQWTANDIRVGCQAKVEERLLRPASVEYADDFFDTDPKWNPSDRSWAWAFGLEAQNAFGVRLQSRWWCEVVDDNFIRVEQLD